MCPPQQNNLFSVRIPICVYFLWQHTHTHSNCVFLFFFLLFFLFGILSLSLIMICVIIVSIRTVPTQNNPRLVLFLFFYILSLSKWYDQYAIDISWCSIYWRCSFIDFSHKKNVSFYWMTHFMERRPFCWWEVDNDAAVVFWWWRDCMILKSVSDRRKVIVT